MIANKKCVFPFSHSSLISFEKTNKKKKKSDSSAASTVSEKFRRLISHQWKIISHFYLCIRTVVSKNIQQEERKICRPDKRKAYECIKSHSCASIYQCICMPNFFLFAFLFSMCVNTTQYYSLYCVHEKEWKYIFQQWFGLRSVRRQQKRVNFHHSVVSDELRRVGCSYNVLEWVAWRWWNRWAGLLCECSYVFGW